MVRKDRHAFFAVEFAYLVPHGCAARGVEAGCRFIEEQDLRLVDQRHREVEPTLHAARVRLDAVVDGRTDVNQADDVVHALSDVWLAEAVQLALEVQHLAAALLAVDRAVLERDADTQPDVAGLCGDVVTADTGPTGGRAEQCAQHLHHGRLAGTVRAEEAVDLAGQDRQSRRRRRPRCLRKLDAGRVLRLLLSCIAFRCCALSRRQMQATSYEHD